MKLYLISNTEPFHEDQYQSFVVGAMSKVHAKNLNPEGKDYREDPKDWDCLGAWVRHPDDVDIRFLGMCAGNNVGFGEIICVDLRSS